MTLQQSWVIGIMHVSKQIKMAEKEQTKPAQGLLILAITLPEPIFNMICIDNPPNTKAGNVALAVDAVNDIEAGFATGAIVSVALNQSLKNKKG